MKMINEKNLITKAELKKNIQCMPDKKFKNHTLPLSFFSNSSFGKQYFGKIYLRKTPISNLIGTALKLYLNPPKIRHNPGWYKYE